MNVRHINTVCIWYYAISCSNFLGQSSQMVFMHQMVRWLTDESDMLEFLLVLVVPGYRAIQFSLSLSGWYLDIYCTTSTLPQSKATHILSNFGSHPFTKLKMHPLPQSHWLPQAHPLTYWCVKHHP